ncbi:hypothetical protein D3C71_328710 [compost metagenome]
MTSAPLLTLRPDGARPRTESIEFLTDVSTSLDGTERRVPLRAFPRYTFTSQFTFMTDEAREQRDMLRYADRVGFPLTVHPVPSGANKADAGAATAGHYVSRRKTGEYAVLPAGAVPLMEWSSALEICPYVEGRIDPSRTITHRSAGISSAVLSFVVDDLDEAVGPWTGQIDATRKPVWPVRADWSADVSERIDDIADSADFGHRTLHEVRYSLRVISVSLLLIGRPAILEFRRLVFALQGRCNPFRYAFEPDAVERTWRLNSDTVAIDYLRNSLARVELEFLELAE